MKYNFVVFDCLVSLGIMAVIWFFLFARLRRDDFRSEIRRLRDGLFDFMWQNGYSYNDQGYRETRQMLNGLLRLGNTLTPVTLIASVTLGVAREKAGYESPDFCKLPDGPLGKELERVRKKAMAKTYRFVFLSGIFGVFMRGFIFLSRSVRSALSVKKWLARKTTEFLEAAYLMGSPNLRSHNCRSMAKFG